MAKLKSGTRIYGTATVDGNLTAGNISANYISGDGSQLTGLPPGYTNSDVAAYLPTYSGNISANVITANVFIGDGSQLTGLPESYSNVNVAAYLPTYSGDISANVVTANVFIGDGSQLTGLPEGYSNVKVAAYLPTYSGVIGGAITIGGNLSVDGNLNVAGTQTTFNSESLNINDPIIYLADNNPGDVLDIGFISSFTNPGYQHTGFVRDATDGTWKLFANVATEPTTSVDFTDATYSNLRIGGLTAISANISGNVSAVNFIGSGAQLTGLYANADVAAYLPIYSGNISAGNISANTSITISGSDVLDTAHFLSFMMG